MISKKQLTAIILAGGKSSRMGTDKGFIVLNKKPFIQHIINAVIPLTEHQLIVSNNVEYDIFGLKRVSDIIPESGPLAGIHTGLYHSNTPYSLVLSCDIPLINTEVLQLLIDHTDESNDVTQLASKGETMPLIALYKKSCLATCLQALQQGEKRLRKVLKQLQVKTIDLEESLTSYTTNINTPEQLNALTNGTNN